MVTEVRKESGRLDRRIVQAVLRGGLLVSVALMVAGLAIRIATGDLAAGAVPLFHLFRTGRVGDDLMALGILVLAVVPAMRVAALIILWARERDWRFVGVALAVIVVLGLAVLAGRG